MKKIGNLTLDIVLPLLLMDANKPMTKKELYGKVKHKVTVKEFNTSLKNAYERDQLWITFEPNKGTGKSKRLYEARDIYGSLRSMHSIYMYKVIEELNNNTLMQPRESLLLLEVKIKDIHVNRLIKHINSLPYAEVEVDGKSG